MFLIDQPDYVLLFTYLSVTLTPFTDNEFSLEAQKHMHLQEFTFLVYP
jgi:hypothetical protein